MGLMVWKETGRVWKLMQILTDCFDLWIKCFTSRCVLKGGGVGARVQVGLTEYFLTWLVEM